MIRHLCNNPRRYPGCGWEEIEQRSRLGPVQVRRVRLLLEGRRPLRSAWCVFRLGRR